MRRLFGALLVATGALLSCQVILGLDEPIGTQPPVPARDAAPETPDLCVHDYVPEAPNVPDDQSTSGEWFATRTYDLPYRGDGGLGTGLDLDQSCTCNPDPAKRDARDGGPSCKPITALNSYTCDRAGGVDDSFGSSLGSFFAKATPLDPRSDGNDDINHGLRTVMVHVAGWNGEPNDKSVTVVIVASSGLVTPEGCPGRSHETPDASIVGGQLYYPPQFDGCDQWSIQPLDAVEDRNLAAPPTLTSGTGDNGYVRDGVLVANLDHTPLTLLGANAFANAGHLVARITTVPGVGHRLDGFLAGRVSFDDVIKAAAGIPVEIAGNTTPLCAQPQFASFVKTVCDDLDLMAQQNQDNTGQVCDAVSVTFGIHAVTSLVANKLRTLDAGVLPCADASFSCF